MNKLKVIGISGSLRQGSYNTSLLRTAQRDFSDQFELEIADISQIPFYNDDVEKTGFPEAVLKLQDQIESAEALLISTPEYNYSIPGVLKNTLDWLSRPPRKVLQHKSVAIMGASDGMIGTARAQLQLKYILLDLSMYVLPKPDLYIPNSATNKFENGLLIDDKGFQKLKEFLLAFEDWIKKFNLTTIE